jgi:hypothetical protein
MKNCHGGRVHDDAAAIVTYLMDHGGRVARTNEGIAFELGMFVNLGGGVRKTDMSRFSKARNHIKDASVEASPCTGYRLHYRTTVKGSELVLIDPSGDLGDHLWAVVETARGWAVREAQHHTENLRQTEIFERLGEHALNRQDRQGYRLCQKAAMEIERDGTLTPATMADLMVWMDSLGATLKAS